MITLLVAGCGGAPDLKTIVASSPAVSRPAETPSVSSPPSRAPSPARTYGAANGCSLLGGGELLPVPVDSGRCRAGDFNPVMTFDPAPGWSGAGNDDVWVLTRDDGYYTELRVYRYGGAVVPAYCQDPPHVVPTASASEIVAWLETVEGLQVDVTGRSVGPYPAWQLDLSARGAPSCAPGKMGLVPLWIVDGQEILFPQTIDGEGRARAYLIELPETIVIMWAAWHEIDDPEPFLQATEAIFSSLAIELE
jgi:hypothetical protein